jgi:4-amino-4-deoxy-L-arabinose transferase-like glycosyltransferase
MRNADFLRVFIWQHNFQRYLTPIFEHRQPFWFFGAVFLLAILPWLPVFVSGCFDAVRTVTMENCRNSPALFIACWSLFTLFFFSLSQSKLPGYILPAIPPAMLLVAISFVRQIERNAKGLRVAVACAALVFPLILGLVLVKRYDVFDALFRYSATTRNGFLLGFVVAAAGGGFVLGLSMYRKWVGALNMLACMIGILLVFANLLVLPGLDEIISPRAMAQRLMAGSAPTQDDVAVFNVPRAYEYGLDYYFQKRLPEWTPSETGVRFIFSGKQGVQEIARILAIDNFEAANPEQYFQRAEPKGNVFIIDRNALQKSSGK